MPFQEVVGPPVPSCSRPLGWLVCLGWGSLFVSSIFPSLLCPGRPWLSGCGLVLMLPGGVGLVGPRGGGVGGARGAVKVVVVGGSMGGGGGTAALLTLMRARGLMGLAVGVWGAWSFRIVGGRRWWRRW